MDWFYILSDQRMEGFFSFEMEIRKILDKEHRMMSCWLILYWRFIFNCLWKIRRFLIFFILLRTFLLVVFSNHLIVRLPFVMQNEKFNLIARGQFLLRRAFFHVVDLYMIICAWSFLSNNCWHETCVLIVRVRKGTCTLNVPYANVVALVEALFIRSLRLCRLYLKFAQL